MNWESYDGKL